jgi:hypothetical protein
VAGSAAAAAGPAGVAAAGRGELQPLLRCLLPGHHEPSTGGAHDQTVWELSTAYARKWVILHTIRVIRPRASRGQRWRAGAAAATTGALCAALLGGVPAGHAVAATVTSRTTHAPGTGWVPSTPANWPQVVDESTTPAQTITAGVTEDSG